MASEPLEVWMIFQVVAGTEEAARSSLDDHVEKIGKETGVQDISVEMDDVQEVDKPHPQLEKGYSRVCEAELSVDSFANLVNIVINYGPTSVDVKGPQEVTMDIGEVRESLNSVAQIMHQFLQAGAGGMMISSPQDEK